MSGTDQVGGKSYPSGITNAGGDEPDDEQVVSRVRVIILVLALLGMLALSANLILHAEQSSIDAAQEIHFRFDDQRLDQLEKDRDNVAAMVSTNTDRIAHDEGVGIGLFAAIGVLQGIGLLRKPNGGGRYQ